MVWKFPALWNLVTLLCVASPCFMHLKKEDDWTGCKVVSQMNGPLDHLTLNVSHALAAARSIDNDSYTVGIFSFVGLSFEGFVLQARDAANTDIILGGFFSSPPHTRRRSCGNYTNNILTNSVRSKWENLTVTWIPPSNFVGQVIFWATVNENNGSYWTGLQSAPTDVIAGISETTKKSIPDFQEDRTSQAFHARDCGVKKGCFGMPSNCWDQQDSCQVLVTFTPVDDGVVFQLVGSADELSWIAVGLSDDRKMGDDSVTDCILKDSGKVVVQQSWNYRSPKSNEVLSDPRQGISETKGKFVNGTLSCTWKRQMKTNIHKMKFDILHDKWYLLLARGHTKHGVKRKHHGALASSHNYNLTRISEMKDTNFGDTIRYLDSDTITQSQFQRILLEKQRAIDNYRQYTAILRSKVEYSRNLLLKTAHSLDEVLATKPEE